jgi:hypothetical protein
MSKNTCYLKNSTEFCIYTIFTIAMYFAIKTKGFVLPDKRIEYIK